MFDVSFYFFRWKYVISWVFYAFKVRLKALLEAFYCFLRTDETVNGFYRFLLLFCLKSKKTRYNPLSMLWVLWTSFRLQLFYCLFAFIFRQTCFRLSFCIIFTWLEADRALLPLLPLNQLWTCLLTDIEFDIDIVRVLFEYSLPKGYVSTLDQFCII